MIECTSKSIHSSMNYKGLLFRKTLNYSLHMQFNVSTKRNSHSSVSFRTHIVSRFNPKRSNKRISIFLTINRIAHSSSRLVHIPSHRRNSPLITTKHHQINNQMNDASQTSRDSSRNLLCDQFIDTNSNTTIHQSHIKEEDWKHPTNLGPIVYKKLSKANLSALVVLTTMAGFAMAPGQHSILQLFNATIGTGLCVCSANTFNQWIEYAYDGMSICFSIMIHVNSSNG